MKAVALRIKEEREGDNKGCARWTMKTTRTIRKLNFANDKRENRYFFFSCPALDLWSVGASRKEAERKLREEMLLLLMRCSRYDELDYFLRGDCFRSIEVPAPN